jgi:two-component sensor histidine kinase
LEQAITAMRVIMVDDSAADRKLYRTLLEKDPVGVAEFVDAASGARGLELCRNRAPDCVLLDYKLPDMTGLEFLARLAGDPPEEIPSSAVVMLTGMASEGVAVKALRGGAQDYLSKDSVTAEGLRMAIDKATQKVGLLRSLRDERDRLSRSLAEKDVLLQEVHHRVKNNMQVIVSLLRLQARAFPDENLALTLREMQNRIEFMAQIHEQLYQAGDLRVVDLARHGALIAESLLRTYGFDSSHVNLSMEMEPLTLPVDQAIPAGLILNELVSNTLKHAFTNGRGGSVRVGGSRRGGRVTLEVRDNGAGLDEPLAPKSFGLRIVHILAKQLKGTFESLRETDSRETVFRISFPEVEVRNDRA